MEDQEQRVEEIPKEFNKGKRPSNSSEDADSWTFLEGRSADSNKSVESSPRPPRIVLNNNLLSPDYDAEIEMSDGISVISDGEGHRTPPETEVITADIEESFPEASSSKGMGIAHRLKNVLDDTKNSRKYRQLTDSPKDGEDDEEERDGVVTLLGPNGVPPKEKTDVESFYNTNDPQRLGIYPRHVVFLMVCCGIIGGMIGHLWNMNYNCKCSERTEELAQMYNQIVVERWDLQQTINRYESECKVPLKEPLKWNGHQETDAHIKAEEAPPTSTTTERTTTPFADSTTSDPRKAPGFIPRAEFENLIWQHLRDTDKSRKTRESGSGREERAADGVKGKDSSKEKRYKKYHKGGEEESEEDGSQERFEGKKEYKKHQKYKSKETKYPGQQNGKSDAGSGSDNNHNNNKASKEYVKQKYDNNNKYHRGGGGSGEKPQRFRPSKEEESAEDDDSKENYQRGGRTEYKRKKSQSGEWSDKRQRGRDELRQQRPQQGEKKNWYLERGSEREIDRVETSTN